MGEPRVAERDRELALGIGIRGLERDGSREPGPGFVEATRVGVELAQTERRPRRVGIELGGLEKRLLRGLRVAERATR